MYFLRSNGNFKTKLKTLSSIITGHSRFEGHYRLVPLNLIKQLQKLCLWLIPILIQFDKFIQLIAIDYNYFHILNFKECEKKNLFSFCECRYLKLLNFNLISIKRQLYVFIYLGNLEMTIFSSL